MLLAIIDPVLALIMFRCLPGGAIGVPGGHYVNYLMPGIFVAAIPAAAVHLYRKTGT